MAGFGEDEKRRAVVGSLRAAASFSLRRGALDGLDMDSLQKRCCESSPWTRLRRQFWSAWFKLYVVSGQRFRTSRAKLIWQC